ncbi:MAG: AAA family ATPase [Syntrophaceae bacterium]|nr:AAA family ATPase [Syntrophaceae bacterium]
MYNEFFGFAEEPFRITPDPSFFFMATSHREALSSLLAGIEGRKGILTITGDVGTGKTTLVNTLLKDLNLRIKTAFIFNPRLTFKQLLAAILSDLKVPVTGNSTEVLLHRFDLYLQKRQTRDETVLIIIDEAQNLSPKVLEDLGGLFQRQTPAVKHLLLLLTGQLELEDNLNSEESRQFKRRIAFQYRLTPLNWEESKAYIDHRLKIVGSGISEVFTPEAVNLICDFAKGIPRVINTICDRSLLAGYSLTTPKIGTVIAKAVISEEENVAQELALKEKETIGERGGVGSIDYRILQESAAPWIQGFSDGWGESMKKGNVNMSPEGKEIGPSETLEPIKSSSWLYSGSFLGLYKSLKEKYIDLEAKNNVLHKECIDLAAKIAKKEVEFKAIQDSLKVEEEKRRRAEEILGLMEARVHYLSSEFLDRQEKDKKFIAGELLGVIANLILSLKGGVEHIFHNLKVESKLVLLNFDQSLCNLQNGIQKVEEILVSLYPPTLDDPGIRSTIVWYCEKFQKYHPQLQITQEIDIQENEIVGPLKTQVFRILQDALDLFAEHNQSGQIYVSFIKKDGHLLLTVEEKGQDFDLHDPYPETNGAYYTRMKQRAELSGGSLSFESAEAVGTSIRASWPI